MTEQLITFTDLSIGYNGRSVLSGISFSMARGSFTAIVGANGSGKTTLLKTVLKPVSYTHLTLPTTPYV